MGEATTAVGHLGEALDAAVARGPEREAIAAEGVRLTYGALAREVEAVAAALRASGVAPGERVAVILPNVPAFPIAFFGIARAGAVALPLHPRAPETEIARALADAGVRTTIAEAALAPVLRRARPRPGPSFWTRPGQVGLALEPDGLPARSDPALPLDATAPVLSQYSTGQGGAPRRVTRTHGQLGREVASVTAALGIGPDDRILGLAPLFHAYGFVNTMLCALTTGAALVLLDASAGDLPPRHVLRALAAERITRFPGVPFLFDALVATADREPLDLRALRSCTSAGAPLSPPTAAAFADRFGVPVHQLYGTTEVGVVSVDRGEGVAASVGFPIRGVEVSIVDDAGRPLPPGAPGEVAIRSETAASGYDPPDPGGASRFEGGAFLPGDLGRLDPSGRLFLTGRRPRFVNVGGNKVDPSEVERVLRALDGVLDAAVVGVADPVRGERVKAVVVAAPGCDRARILAHCRDRLAPHAVPHEVRFRPEIPRSPLGKVLRKALIDEDPPGAP